jgi:hypothetical protein
VAAIWNSQNVEWYESIESFRQKEDVVAKTPERPDEGNPVDDAGMAGQADAPGAQAARQAQRVQMEIDDSKALALYANFCRVTGTPEELIIDFGLSPQQPVGVQTQPIVITQRIITNYYTAKRMLHALQLTVQRHEATFGVLETDIQKRIRPGFMQGQTPNQ